MGRYQDNSNVNWVPAGTGVVGGYTSPAVNMLGSVGVSVTVINAGTTVAGTWKWQATDFGAGDLYLADLPPGADFVDITGASIAATAGVQRLELLNTCAKWVRLVFVDSGSVAATAQAAVTVRRRGDD